MKNSEHSKTKDTSSEVFSDLELKVKQLEKEKKKLEEELKSREELMSNLLSYMQSGGK